MLSERQLKLVDLLEQQPCLLGDWRGKLAFQAEPSCAILTTSILPSAVRPAFSPVAVRAISWKLSTDAVIFSFCNAMIMMTGCWPFFCSIPLHRVYSWLRRSIYLKPGWPIVSHG